MAEQKHIQEYLEALQHIEEGCAILRPMLTDLVDIQAVGIDEIDLIAAKSFRQYLMDVAETIRDKE